MKIATWNINHVVNRYEILRAWLDVTSPDVVALQELKATQAEFPHDALRSAGYHALWVGQKSWNGVAILARGREPVEVRRSLPGDDADKQARYLEAAVGGVLIACLYAPNGNPSPGPKFDQKVAWMKRLRAHASGLQASGHPVVLLGDFNVVPTDRDIYSPRTWRDNALLQSQPRALYQDILAQGWTDALRDCHPDDAVYTFWDYRRRRLERNAGLRIDHILLSTPLRARLVDAGVDVAVRHLPDSSDHAPVWVELADA